VKKEYADLLRQVDHIYIEELYKHNLYHEVSQAFVVILSVRSVGVVGVVGDARCYEYVVTLRAVKFIDFMAAKFAHLPFEFLEEVSRCIINEVSCISRVAYDV
jgi:GMP synthase (glutamine-hydrolysing)